MKIYIKKSEASNFELIETPEKELGKGGQARVFKIRTRGYEEYCLKVFIRMDDAQKNYNRISYMIQHPPRNIMGNSGFRICWPTAFAYDLQKNFIGYVMPLAFPNSRDLKILEVYNAKPISQQAKYKKYPDWFGKYELDTEIGLKNRMKMLCNWAIAVYSLHETHKYIIVDLKPENVMATSSGKISIVDTDSFQISENGRILFHGAAYTPAYFPPEGKSIKQQNAPFPISCDCFAAAVCFYKILTGVHPFGGTIKKPPYDKLETEEEFISAGLFAYGCKKQFLGFNADFNLHKHFYNLPSAIQVLFVRAFDSPHNRPTMEEWGKALYEAATSKVSLIRSSVKPPVSNSLSIQITDVKFADKDFDGNVIRTFGSKLYTDVSYLCPQITCKVLKTASVQIWYKIYSPTGELQCNASSKPGYTSNMTLNCNATTTLTFSNLSGWGNKNKQAYAQPGTWRVEFYEGDKCLYKTSVEIHKKAQTNDFSTTFPTFPSPTPVAPTPSVFYPPKKQKTKRSRWWLWLLLAGIVAGGIYSFWYVDYKRDKEAPRSYVFATNLFLRSSAKAGVEHNQIAKLPYGAELITYSSGTHWAYVKADGKEGYVASPYLLDADDFRLLDGVWGNEDAKEAVATAKCRLAVLDFLKSNNMNTGSDAWQIFTKPIEMKPNSVLYPKLDNGYNDFTDFAFILTDNASGDRKAALYSFEADETPVFCAAQEAEGEYIKFVTYNERTKTYKFSYSAKGAFHKVQAAKEKEFKQPSSGVWITSITFANMDYNNNIITGYGQPLYTDVQFLKPRITFKKPSEATETAKLQVKIYKPDNTLEQGKGSPAGCTFERTVSFTGKEGSLDLASWGNSEGTGYKAGNYRYEIWHDGTKLFSKTVTIHEKSTTKVTDALTVLSVLFSNVDYDGNVLTNFGRQLYSDTQYLRARVTFKKPSANAESITLQVKIYKPDNSLAQGKSSPVGCTFEQKISLSGKENTVNLTGWGNKNGTSYKVGDYRYEIWHEGKMLFSKIITIKDKE